MLTSHFKHDKAFDIMTGDVYDLMTEAIKEAEKAAAHGEVPVGAVITDEKGSIIARGYNQPISLNDPTAHAEILAMRQAALVRENYRLPGHTLVVTIEPCIMCMGAALNARIARLIFGAFDPKGGGAGSLYNLAQDNRLNHTIEVVSGVRSEECRELLQDFFRSKRSQVV